MGYLLHPRFWIGLFVSLAGLSAAGAAFAWLIVPTPPRYHRTTFFEFPLPPDWSCDRSGTETVCYPVEPPPHSATIILAAKWRAPYDTNDAYRQYLSKPRPWKADDGSEVVPEVLYVRETVLGGHVWVDSRHRNSELVNYVTRYMATVTTDIGVLVTYSINEQRLDRYDPALSAAVEGLDIYQRAVVEPPG